MLRKLWNLTTGSANPTISTGTNVLPGGAGVQVAGSSANPFISGPRVEEFLLEVLDVTASATAPTPAVTGKLLIMDATTGTIGGHTWRQNAIPNIRIAGGQYGIVFAPGAPAAAVGQVSEAVFRYAAGGYGGGSGTSTGTKALVCVDGPCMALVSTSPTNTTAISAGMLLAADALGNLTYAGANPSSGAVLATAMGAMAASISAPALMPVFVGGF